ncbi:MAG: C40 family peptidase [Mycobacterium sp.]|nr:C40 family peptidase [Mycobacterium sp.]MBV8292545.1 C40 family peptidase [Mycobacterium sp.]
MRRGYAIPTSLALLLTLPMISPNSAAADPQVPTLPGPSLQGPTLPGQSVQRPTLAAPSLQSPTLGAPSVQGPALAGYQQSTTYVIQRALAQRGVPFLYGGGNAAGPTRGTGLKANVVGFDASGLIQYAYAGAGLKMPRTSGEQCNVGRKVALSQAKPGDLMCYGPGGTQSVAMYLGNGQMIEATEPGVTVSPARTNGMVPYLTRIIES